MRVSANTPLAGPARRPTSLAGVPAAIERQSLTPTRPNGPSPALLARLQATSATEPNLTAAVARMKAIRDAMLRRHDPRAAFATAYIVQTDATIQALATPGYFRDPAFINRLALRFAQYYFDANEAYDGPHPERTSEPWRRVFAMASDRNASMLETLLLSIDVHINYDMPRALAAVGMSPVDAIDYQTYNQLFSRDVTAAKPQLLALTRPIFGRFRPAAFFDRLLFGLDDKLTLKTIQTMRNRSFDLSQRLAKGDPAAFAAIRRNTLAPLELDEDVADNRLHRFVVSLGLL